MKTKKVEVFEFDPQIYPIKFWILIKPTESSISNNFTKLNGDKINVDLASLNSELVDAFVKSTPVKYTKTSKYGFIVGINNPECITPAIIAHEATHLAGHIWEHLNESTICLESEPNAYLVGWIVDCIDQVITKLKK